MLKFSKALFKITKTKLIPKKSTYIILKKKLIDINYPKDFQLLKNIC